MTLCAAILCVFLWGCASQSPTGPVSRQAADASMTQATGEATSTQPADAGERVGDEPPREGGAFAVDPAVAAILDQLESAGQAIDTIQCPVRYRIDDKLNLTEITKFGSIRFKKAQPHAMFRIEFDKLVADDVVHREKEWWLFRDRWLTEGRAKSKTIIRRETLREGEQVDLFDLEKAPFPIPFGQRKAQILRNFTVSLVERQVGDPENCDHLVCRPIEGAPMARDYKRLDFYVSRELHLPLRIIAESANGDQVTVADFPDLGEANVNADLPDGAFALPADEVKGFAVSEEPLKE